MEAPSSRLHNSGLWWPIDGPQSHLGKDLVLCQAGESGAGTPGRSLSWRAAKESTEKELVSRQRDPGRLYEVLRMENSEFDQVSVPQMCL